MYNANAVVRSATSKGCPAIRTVHHTRLQVCGVTVDGYERGGAPCLVDDEEVIAETPAATKCAEG